MKKLIALLIVFPLQAMQLEDVEEGKGIALTLHRSMNITISGPELQSEQVANVIKTYFPGANGNVTRHVTPLLINKINRSSDNCFENSEKLQRLIAESIDEALAEKQREITNKDVEIARINRNKKVMLAVVTALSALSSACITAIITLAPTMIAYNTDH